MPIIYVKNVPDGGTPSAFDNLVGYQLVNGGGLTYGTFEFFPGITETIPRKFLTNVFDSPINLETLGISNIGDIKTILTKEFEVYPNYDISQVMNFVMYGSLSKRFSVSITNIINNFPASIDVNYFDNELNTGYTATNIVYDEDGDYTTFDINISKIHNPLGVDFSKNAENNLLSKEIKVSEYRNITKYYSEYALSISGITYPILFLNPSVSLNDGILNITVSGSPFGVSGTDSITSYIIRPNDYLYNLVLKSQFDEFEQYILNTISSPIYTMTLQVPQENEDGQFSIVNTNITFPLDGVWNIDIITPNFDNYLNTIQEIATYFDNVRTNLISRFFVSDSLKEFDTFDRRIESMLQIYGRSFDEVKKFIDSLAYMNSANYTPKNDIPSQLLLNLSKTLGWEDNFQFLTDQNLIDSIFGNTSDFKYPAYNRSQTPLELNYAFYRNLVINSFYLFKSKGTRRSIEFILRLVGAPEALVEFNEHIYIADQKINLTKFNTELDKLQTGNHIDIDPILSPTTYILSGKTYTAITQNTTSTVLNFNTTNYPVDKETGYPKQPKDSNQLFFQMGAGWYQLTPKHKSLEIATRTGVAPNVQYGTEFEPFTYGNKYLDIFRKFPYIDEGFTISKFIDNKKSWSRDNTLLRVSSDGNYNAYYSVSDERLLLNVKNVNVFLNPAQGLLYDVWVQSVDNNYPIPQSGLTYPYPTSGGTDATFINPEPKTKSFFEFASTFAKNMINTRNRMYITDGKTGGYPTLQSIFWKYIEAPYAVNIPTNKYTYDNLIKFVEGINPYWIKLVEQMIPATTLWMGGIKFENSIFHRQKYAYKRVINVNGTIPKKITFTNIEISSVFVPIVSGDDYITSPIFSDICIKNGITMVATPTESFASILGNAITSTINEFDLNCGSDNVLTSWYSELILNNTIVAKIKFYDGIGNDDVPTTAQWESALLSALPNLYYFDVNYENPSNGFMKIIDLDCVDEIAVDKLLTINVGVDVSIIC